MSSYIDRATRKQVATRANKVCEYCLIAEEDSYFRHQVEHIISLKHNGSSDIENLAFACVFCNRNKGSDIGSVIPGTMDDLVRLFNPRTDRWVENFRINGVVIEPLTKCAEATIRILQINHDNQLMEREILARRGRYPTEEARLLILEN